MTEQTFWTRAVHAGRDDLTDQGLHAVPLDLSTTYPSRDSRDEAERLDVMTTGAQVTGPPIYARLGNPTVARFEGAIAELEGCESGVAFASGMAALSACLLATVAAGRPHVVAVRPLYGTSDHLIASGLLGNQLTWADPADVGAAVRPETGLVIVESPANPTLAEIDIRAVVDAAGGVPVLVDNTFATPALQRPTDFGAAAVLHSATKFLGGHGDAMGGVVTCAEEFAQRLRQVRIATGGVLHPSAAYLLQRGLATLPVRMERSSATAAVLAERLLAHPKVSAVHYPDPSKLGQLATGGAMLSFEAETPPHEVVSAVRLITPAVSLGSTDTLLQHPASLSHHIVAPEDRAAGGIPDTLLRLSVGLESPEDLWRDLDRALNQTT
ncbi:trans-sulfuration enzyme family protein [Saccharopolyspora endophytica]|uniref:PLP-dependent transferase n=1 Tax=Saccharopolyspora endophytica TaxID=543886 RepID=A0ABS5DE42_9PSEU|nr:PLP-dependent transferase [Saccharopolyspora endophytica]MBQ0924542.1 PLP-dependent transferase [Saccharopolyspora endophytica]